MGHPIDPNLERLRSDLAAVQRAAGLAPRWTSAAIRTSLLLAAAGAAAAVWAVVPHGLWPVAGMAAFAIPVIDWWWQARGRADRTAADDREWQEALAVFWYTGPLLLLGLWSRAVGLDLITTVGLMWFMLGFVLFGPAVSEHGMRPLLPWALSFMIGGLLVPLRVAPVLAIVGAAISAGAVVSAVWIAIDLRRPPAA